MAGFQGLYHVTSDGPLPWLCFQERGLVDGLWGPAGSHWLIEKHKNSKGRWEGSPLLHNSVSKTPQPQCKENRLPFLLRPSQPGAQSPACSSLHNESSSIVTWLQQPSTPKANGLTWFTTPLQWNYVKHATTWCNTSSDVCCIHYSTVLRYRLLLVPWKPF